MSEIAPSGKMHPHLDEDDENVDDIMHQEEDAEVQLIADGAGLTISERWASLVVRRTKLLYGLAWLGMFMISGIVFVSGWFDVQQMVQNDWIVGSSLESEQADALTDARERLDVVNSFSLPTRSEQAPLAHLQVIISRRSGQSIFTARAMQVLCELEREFLLMDDFPKFCQTTNATSFDINDCVVQENDLVGRFYPTIQDQLACNLLTDQFVNEVLVNSTNPEDFGQFVNDAYWESGAIQKQTKSEVRLGGPLPGFNELTFETDDKQGLKYEPILDELEKKLKEKYGLKKESFFASDYFGEIVIDGDIEIKFHGYYFRENQFDELVQSDQLLAAASAILVGVFAYIHVRSVFVVANSMFAIVFSIPLALFLYTGIFQIAYFNSVHVVVIFLVLGIGASDLYIMTDAFYQSETLWKQLRGMKSKQDAAKRDVYGTGDMKMEVLIGRMAYTWRRGSKSVFNTTFTTCAAFFATAVSPVAPIAGFGIYSGLAVFVLYLQTLFVFPIFVMMHEKYFSNRPFCCACVRAEKQVDLEKEESTEKEMHAAHQEQRLEDRLIIKYYIPMMQISMKLANGRKLKVVALAWLIVMTTIYAIFGYFASNLSTPTELDEPFSSKHMFTGFQKSFSKDFSGGQDFVEQELVYGIKGIDRQDMSKFDPTGPRGVVLFDEQFDLAPRANQEYLISVCDSIVDLPCEGNEGCRDERLVTQVNCTIKEFHEWHDSIYSDVPAIDLGDTNKTVWIERLLQFSLANDRILDVGIVDGDLKFIVIRFTTSLEILQPVEVKTPIIQILKDWLSEQPTAPAGMQTVFQTSFDWLWIKTENGIVEGMLQGLLISLPLGLLILFLSSRNVVLSLLGIFSIIGILVSVMGTIYVAGYFLGIAEAIAVVMSVGLSLDYIVHMATMYSAAREVEIDSRSQRFAFAASKMGGTVIGAAVTTIGSAIVMFFTVIAFFRIMGLLLVVTMIFSASYCFLFFLSMLLLFGPQRDQCQIKSCK